MALRQRVEALLSVHEQEKEFLKSNPQLAPTLEQQSISEAVGQEIGRYKLLQQIGEGGFGVVYMAEQARPIRRKVALKLIKPGMDSKAVIARFEAERQALAMMDHPNIARVFDGGVTDSGRPYFVMELVRGVPITEYCNSVELPTRDRLQLFISVCQAVQHAHQKGIIHRDLKPSNILITLHDDSPVVKVIDFGVAKAINQQLTERTLFTTFGNMIGTPQYMSPEQAAISGLDVDTRSDVYSLGVLLYELLTGSTPIESERLRTAGYGEIQRMIREEEPPKPSTRLSTSAELLSHVAKQHRTTPDRLQTAVKRDMDWIVMKALEKDRQRRYETASSLAADVSRYLSDEPIAARPPSAGYRVAKFVRRNRILVTSCTLVIAALSIGLAVALSMAQQLRMKNEDLAQSQQESHDNLTKLREVAFDWAISETLTGDEDRAREAIALAEEAQVSRGWTQILKAQTEFNNGRYADAILNLNKVVDSQDADERYAAQSLMAVTQIWNGNDPGFMEWITKVRAASPDVSADAKWFRVQAESIGDYRLASQLLKQTMESRSRPAYLITRAQIDLVRAVQELSPEMIAHTLSDLEYAELFTDRSFRIHLAKIDSNSHGHEIARIRKDTLEMERYIKNLRKLTSEMPFPSSMQNAAYLTTQAEALIRLNKPFDAISLAENYEWANSSAIMYHASHIFAHLEIAEGLSRFEKLKVTHDNPYALVSKAFFLADLHDRRDELAGIYDELSKSKTFQHRFGALWILALMCDRDRLVSEAQRVQASASENAIFWGFKESLLVLQGRADQVDMVEAKRDLFKSIMIPFHQGMLHLSERKPALAKPSFKACVDLGGIGTFEYNWARAILSKMDRDRNWPSWGQPEEKTY